MYREISYKRIHTGKIDIKFKPLENFCIRLLENVCRNLQRIDKLETSFVNYSFLIHCFLPPVQIAGFAALDVALGMYERVYYPLVPQSSTSTAASAGGGEREKGGSGVVVDIDRTAGAPVVTLRSPLQVGTIRTE